MWEFVLCVDYRPPSASIRATKMTNQNICFQLICYLNECEVAATVLLDCRGLFIITRT